MSSSPCLEVKTGFLSPLSSPMFKKKAVKSRGRGNEKLWACRGPNFEIIHCPAVDFFPLKKKNTQKWYPESISAFGVSAVRGAAIVTIGNRQVPCSQLCSLACFISGSKLPLLCQDFYSSLDSGVTGQWKSPVQIFLMKTEIQAKRILQEDSFNKLWPD